ncbi:MAG: phosphoesterase [Desulfobacteraceae bacterium]|nr:phosphoesterase [Desulfobacteraceae bacterium]
MKINYMSDLHLEMGFPSGFQVNGDILILAGDIIDGKLRGLEILETICARFNHVIMVMGNHEHYKGRFDKTYSKLKENLPSNVHLLENEAITIDRQRFIGCSLWTYMSEMESYLAKVRMNDYRLVKIKDKGIYRKLSTRDTIRAHKVSVAYLKENIKEGDIVITHHAPSFASCNPDYTGNTAYATDLSDIIFDTKPKYWIHGHIHDPVNYEIGDTIVTSNPHGYYRHENTRKFDPYKGLVI